jgi:glycosyltransferase involved in cell wall biosynthesis
MKIGQVAPLWERVPPKRYGGTERIVSYLTEELVDRGHDVTLFASGDSITSARLVAPCVQSLRTDEQSLDPMAPHILMFEQVLQRTDDLDIVHFHTDYVQFPMMRRHSVPHVTTLHGRLDIPELAPLYREFDDEPVVSISNSHRGPLPWAHWQATIYHGIPEDLYAPRPTSGSYLAFLGRISPEKGADAAIAIARQVGMPLKIAAKIGEPDRRYFEAAIKPLLRDPLVEFLGEIDDGEKQRLLGEAAALLFPIDWPEPFGLVLIEAMACGTPVIAFRRGSVPEVIDDGITGFVVDDVAGAVRAFERVATFDRVRCRRVFEERFSARRMAEDYLVLYQKLIEAK